MQCPFPDGTIPIVYVNTFFAVFHVKSEVTEGVVDDFWKTAARYLNCAGVRYIHEQDYASTCERSCRPGNCSCDGDLGRIERGEAFSLVDVRSYNKMRFAKFRYTFPVDITQYAFFEGRPVDREQPVAINFFIVFSTFTFILIVISVALYFVLRKVETRILGHPTMWTAYIALQFTYLLALHSAEFQGNTIVARNHKPRTFNETIAAIQSGQLSWETRGEMIREATQILGSGTSFRETDLVKLAEAVCNDASVIGSFFIKELHEVLLHPTLMRNCEFYRIINPRAGFHSFEPNLRSFLLPKNTTRKIIEKLNFLVLSLFQYDHREGPMLRRFTLGRSFAESTASPKSQYSPIKLSLFQPIFIICSALLLCAMAVTLLEMAIYAVIKRRRAVVPKRTPISVRFFPGGTVRPVARPSHIL